MVPSRKKGNQKLIALLVFLATVFSGCDATVGPEPIQFGKEECHFCKMMVIDRRYGGKFLSSKGKEFAFDSLDCLVNFYRQAHDDQANVYFLLYDQPGKLARSDQAVFIRFENASSPMGSKFIALSSREAALHLVADPRLPILSWPQLLQE